ncbi:MAG: transposase family protein [Bacillota bacterium]
MAETFVDASRFQGTCYRAANWLPLGQTRGFGRSSSRYYHHGQPKAVWVRPLHCRARALLTALFTAPILQGKGGIRLDLNTVKIGKAGSLLDYLRKLPDPRRPRGIRHRQVSILTVAICAVLCGHRSYTAIGEWAADQDQEILQRLGCRRHSLRLSQRAGDEYQLQVAYWLPGIRTSHHQPWETSAGRASVEVVCHRLTG